MTSDCAGCGAPHEPMRITCSYCGRMSATGVVERFQARERYLYGWTNYRSLFVPDKDKETLPPGEV